MPSKLNQIRVIVTDEENEQIKQQAKEKDLSVSNYFRKKAGLKPLERGKYDRKINQSEPKKK